MLMSLSQRYVFLAHSKAASTSFETAYGDSCEIALGNNQSAGRHPATGDSGKHIKYATFLENFAGFFQSFLPIEHYFVFGVMREPMRRIRSLYCDWSRAAAKSRNRMPGIDDFAQFIDAVVNETLSARATIPSQYSFFMDKDQEISLNYLIRMEEIETCLENLKAVSGLDFKKVLEIRGDVAELSSAPIDPGLQRVVEEYFAEDYELYEQQTDHMLWQWDRSGHLNVEAALRWMAQKGNRFEVASSLLYKARLRLQRDKAFKLTDLIELIDTRETAEESDLNEPGDATDASETAEAIERRETKQIADTA